MHLYTHDFVRSDINLAGLFKATTGRWKKIGHRSLLQGSDSRTGETGVGCDTRLVVKHTYFRSTVELVPRKPFLQTGARMMGRRENMGVESLVPRKCNSPG